MLIIYRVDEIPWSGSDRRGRWWRRGRTSRLLRLGALQCPGALEMFGMNGVRIWGFHSPPILINSTHAVTRPIKAGGSAFLFAAERLSSTTCSNEQNYC